MNRDPSSALPHPCEKKNLFAVKMVLLSRRCLPTLLELVHWTPSTRSVPFFTKHVAVQGRCWSIQRVCRRVPLGLVVTWICFPLHLLSPSGQAEVSKLSAQAGIPDAGTRSSAVTRMVQELMTSRVAAPAFFSKFARDVVRYEGSRLPPTPTPQPGHRRCCSWLLLSFRKL